MLNTLAKKNKESGQNSNICYMQMHLGFIFKLHTYSCRTKGDVWSVPYKYKTTNEKTPYKYHSHMRDLNEEQTKIAALKSHSQFHIGYSNRHIAF